MKQAMYVTFSKVSDILLPFQLRFVEKDIDFGFNFLLDLIGWKSKEETMP